jgi:hypothetical protein
MFHKSTDSENNMYQLYAVEVSLQFKMFHKAATVEQI